MKNTKVLGCRAPVTRIRRMATTVVTLLVVSGVVALAAPSVSAQAAPDTEGAFPDNQIPASAVLDSDRSSLEVGMRFNPKTSGSATGVQVYKVSSANAATPTSGTLWNSSGRQLARVAFQQTNRTGWLSARFTSPVNLTAGETYTVSVFMPEGRYAVTENYFSTSRSNSVLNVPTSNNGVYRYAGSSSFPTSTHRASNYWVDIAFTPSVSATPTTSPTSPTASPTPTTSPTPSRTPSPTPSPTANGAFPGATTTGVPAGVTLKPYTGPTRITTPGTVIDGALITQPLVITAGAHNVTIRNSVVRASAFFLVLNSEGATNLRIIDSELDGRGHTGNDSAVAGRNYTLARVNIHGTVDGVKLGSNVTIQDSYIHDLAMSPGSHNDGMQSLGSDNVAIRHNTVIVPPGATSAIILSTGSARSMRNIAIDNNLLGGGAYTVYGGYQRGVDDLSRVSDIVISNNRITTAVNARGGAYGPFSSVDAPAVTLTGNVWHDGPRAGTAI